METRFEMFVFITHEKRMFEIGKPWDIGAISEFFIEYLDENLQDAILLVLGILAGPRIDVEQHDIDVLLGNGPGNISQKQFVIPEFFGKKFKRRFALDRFVFEKVGKDFQKMRLSGSEES